MDGLIKFQYNGVDIRQGGDDFLNLTDMWKANGSDPNKKPADWQRKEGSAFIEFIEESQGVPRGHLLRKEPGNPKKGEGGSTWAHWQIGLAYAKYLSHDFHAYCNKVVKDHIEQKKVQQVADAARNALLERYILSLPANRGPQWKNTVISVLASWLGQPNKNSRGGVPVWTRSVTSKLARWRLGEDMWGAAKALASESGSKYLDHMSDEVADAMKELQGMILGLAVEHSDYEPAMAALKDKIDWVLGMGYQLSLFQDHSCDCGRKLGTTDRFCPGCGKRHHAA